MKKARVDYKLQCNKTLTALEFYNTILEIQNFLGIINKFH